MFLIASNFVPGVHHQRVRERADRIVRVRDDQHGAHGHPGHRPERLVLRRARCSAMLIKRRRQDATSRASSSSRSTAWRTRSSPRRMRAGSVNTMADWVRDGQPQAVALGGHPAVDDLGQPGRHPARQQRRHPGLPLVGARPPAPDGLEQPGRTRPDRPAGSRTARACCPTTASSICNLVTGDATRAYLTTAAIKDKEQGIGESQAFTGFFFSPTGYLRSFTLFLGEFVKELFQARRTRRSGIQPQMHRGLKYAGHARRQQRAAARRRTPR